MSGNHRNLQNMLKNLNLQQGYKTDISKVNINPLLHSMAETSREFQDIQNQITKSKSEEIERQVRNNQLLEINAKQNDQMIRLKETELEFLKNINEDTMKLVSILSNLEELNRINGTITEANLLLIQQRLDLIIENGKFPGTSFNQLLLEEVKKQMVEKGVGFGIQFLITGLKYLVTTEVPS